MVQLQLAILHLMLLCCCNILTANSKNIFMFEATPPKVCGDAVQEVTVNLSTSLHALDRKYLSIALSPLRVFNDYTGAQKLFNIAAALSPADVRAGGAAANFMTFSPTTSSCQKEQQTAFSDFDDSDIYGDDIENVTFSGANWESFNAFLAKAKWDLLWDLNNFKLKSDGSWDPSNANELLKYSSAKGIPIPYLQIGNEPSGYFHKYNFEITDKVLVEDYKVLKKLLSKYPMYASTKLYGPDVSNVGVSRRAREYLQGFIANGAYDVVEEASVHFYYVGAQTATINDFLSVGVMNILKTMLDTAVAITTASPRALPLRLTETASAYGGGAVGLSDAYAGGFLWLDKLGMCATYGVTRVFRQTLNSGAYGLIDKGNNPRPDYFLSLLFKILIEGPVISTSLKVPNQNLRVYANCARRDKYTPGALVVYFVNVADRDAVLSLPQFRNADLDLYLLTPGDDSGLTSSFVKLNGVTLKMSGDNLPPITPKSHRGDVTVEARTFGFIVVPSAKVTICVNFFRNVDLFGAEGSQVLSVS